MRTFELTRRRRRGCDYAARYFVQGKCCFQPRQFDVLKSVEREAWFPYFLAFAFENVNVCGLGATEVLGVEGTVRIQPLGMAQLNTCACRPVDGKPNTTGDVLAP